MTEILEKGKTVESSSTVILAGKNDGSAREKHGWSTDLCYIICGLIREQHRARRTTENAICRAMFSVRRCAIHRLSRSERHFRLKL